MFRRLIEAGNSLTIFDKSEAAMRPLEAMGARLTLTEGHAPLTIEGTALRAIDYATPVPSAQVKTCVLLAGLQTPGKTTVHEAIRTRDHSELATVPGCIAKDLTRPVPNRSRIREAQAALAA